MNSDFGTMSKDERLDEYRKRIEKLTAERELWKRAEHRSAQQIAELLELKNHTADINRQEIIRLEVELKEADELIGFAISSYDEEWTEARMRKARGWLERRKEKK